jgi:heme-binding NEAT domain protein
MKYKKYLSVFLTGVMVASAIPVNAEAITTTEIGALEDLATSEGAISAYSLNDIGTLSLFEASGFGSANITLAAGEYEIPVTMMKSVDITNASMAGSCIKGGTLIVSSDGTASLRVDLQAVSAFGISDWASDWKVYKAGTKSETFAPEYTVNSDGYVDSITFELPDKSSDGVYVNMFINAMGMAQDAYLALDYSALGESSEVVYEGRKYVSAFGYDVVVKVSVKDDIITNVEISGENFEDEDAYYSKDMLAKAAEGLKSSFNGKSMSDANGIYNIDAVSSATVSSYAIRDAVMSALNLKVGDNITENPSVTIVNDGEYTADISILKADSDDTSSAQRSFITTEVPIEVKDGKMYVQLAYTSSMIEKIEQLSGDSYVELAKTATDGGNYVLVELGYLEDIASIQFTINTGTAYGVMVNQARVKINADTLKAVEKKTIVNDGNYTADISILKMDSDDTSSAQRSFTTTEVPIEVKDGKMYVQLAYTSPMIEKIEQLSGEAYVELAKTATDDGNYVLVELDYLEDIANIQFTINTGTAYGVMVNQARVKINADTLKESAAEMTGVSSAKAQAVDGNGIMFMSSVDSLNYKEVGFILESNGKSVKKSTTTVYTSIANSNYSAAELGGSYMFAFTVENIDNLDADIKVIPYAVDLDGNEISSEAINASVNSISSSNVKALADVAAEEKTVLKNNEYVIVKEN